LDQRLKHSVDISQNVMIPVSDDVISGILQNHGSRFVLACPFGVLPAVNFNNELEVQCDKIDDIASNRLLPLKFNARQAPIVQLAPHHLSVGHTMPQSAHKLTHGGAPSPHPLPGGERVSGPQILFAVANSCPIHY
jgi:hypothetical protein